MKGFDRMATSWFKPPPEAKPSREPRVTKQITDKVKPTVDERTAMAAAEVLENHSLTRVFDRLRTSALNEFTTSQVGSAGYDQREKAHVKITVLDEIRAEMQAMADEMKLHRQQNPDN